MLARHLAKYLVAAGGQPHPVGAAVTIDFHAFDQALGHQLVRDAGDVAAGDHHAARQLVHLQAVGVALQLGHQVKAWQRGVKLFAQLGAHLLFDQLGTGQQSQPQAQGFRVLAVTSFFHVHRKPFMSSAIKVIAEYLSK